MRQLHLAAPLDARSPAARSQILLRRLARPLTQLFLQAAEQASSRIDTLIYNDYSWQKTRIYAPTRHWESHTHAHVG